MILMKQSVLFFSFCIFLSIVNFSCQDDVEDITFQDDDGGDDGGYDGGDNGGDDGGDNGGNDRGDDEPVTPEVQAMYNKVERARLAQAAGRYGTMAKAMKQAAEKAIQYGIPLNNDEQYLIEFAYKVIADNRRGALNLIHSREEEPELAEDFKQVLNELKQEVMREQTIICQDVLKLMESLTQEEENEESLIFYYTMRGDYHRYMAEVKTLDEITSEAEKSRDMYIKAYEKAKKVLSPTNSIRLGLTTKLTVLYGEIYFAPLEAYKIADEAIRLAEEEGRMDDLNEDELANIKLITSNRELFKRYAGLADDKKDKDEQQKAEADTS